MKYVFFKSLVMSLLLSGLSSISTAKELGSIANTRFGTNYTLDGSLLSKFRTKLLDTNNFGSGGTVNETINITDTAATITTSLLSTFDAFFIGFLDDADGNAFTNSELSAMSSYVNNGGTMIVTCDHPAYDAVCTNFGYPITSISTITPANPTAAGTNHPIFTAPFGVVTSVALDGTVGAFASTAGAVVLAEDPANNAVIIERTLGSGKLIILTDINIFWGGLTSGGTITSNNDRFVTNLITYALGPFAPVTPAAVPSLSFYSLILLTGLLGLFGMRTTRRTK